MTATKNATNTNTTTVTNLFASETLWHDQYALDLYLGGTLLEGVHDETIAMRMRRTRSGSVPDPPR